MYAAKCSLIPGRFPGVQKYMIETVAECRQNGWRHLICGAHLTACVCRLLEDVVSEKTMVPADLFSTGSSQDAL